MKIAVLGTGTVGRTLAEKIDSLGHDVVVGTRDVEATLARTEPDRLGNPPFAQWQANHPGVRLVTFADAGRHAEAVINATSGAASLSVLRAVGADHLEQKILIDVANPLDFSTGWPPALSPANTDSLGEQIQRAFPGAKVVKTLNTVNARVMVDPARVPGRHTVFVAGNDSDAKESVTGLLEEFGWNRADVMDLGDLHAARGMEMYLLLWLFVRGVLNTSDFNVNVVSAARL